MRRKTVCISGGRKEGEVWNRIVYKDDPGLA